MRKIVQAVSCFIFFLHGIITLGLKDHVLYFVMIPPFSYKRKTYLLMFALVDEKRNASDTHNSGRRGVVLSVANDCEKGLPNSNLLISVVCCQWINTYLFLWSRKGCGFLFATALASRIYIYSQKHIVWYYISHVLLKHHCASLKDDLIS